MTLSGPVKWALRNLGLQADSEMGGEIKTRIARRERNTRIERGMMLFEQ